MTIHKYVPPPRLRLICPRNANAVVDHNRRHGRLKTVEAWSFANLGTSCRRRARDDLERPALRSTKNALGVLAGGGETDLAEEGSAEVTKSLSLELSKPRGPGTKNSGPLFRRRVDVY